MLVEVVLKVAVEGMIAKAMLENVFKEVPKALEEYVDATKMTISKTWLENFIMNVLAGSDNKVISEASLRIEIVACEAEVGFRGRLQEIDQEINPDVGLVEDVPLDRKNVLADNAIDEVLEQDRNDEVEMDVWDVMEDDIEDSEDDYIENVVVIVSRNQRENVEVVGRGGSC